MTFEASDDSLYPNGSESGTGQSIGLDELLPLESGDRLWKLYIFRPASGRATHLEHRIYSKIKPDGRLALVTFALHRPAEGPAARSGVARVPDLTAGELEHIVEAIKRESHTDADEYEEIDLSHLPTVAEQLAYVRSRLQDEGQA